METQINTTNDQKQIELTAERLAELLIRQVQIKKDNKINKNIERKNGNTY